MFRNVQPRSLVAKKVASEGTALKKTWVRIPGNGYLLGITMPAPCLLQSIYHPAIEPNRSYRTGGHHFVALADEMRSKSATVDPWGTLTYDDCSLTNPWSKIIDFRARLPGNFRSCTGAKRGKAQESLSRNSDSDLDIQCCAISGGECIVGKDALHCLIPHLFSDSLQLFCFP